MLAARLPNVVHIWHIHPPIRDQLHARRDLTCIELSSLRDSEECVVTILIEFEFMKLVHSLCMMHKLNMLCFHSTTREQGDASNNVFQHWQRHYKRQHHFLAVLIYAMDRNSRTARHVGVSWAQGTSLTRYPDICLFESFWRLQWPWTKLNETRQQFSEDLSREQHAKLYPKCSNEIRINQRNQDQEEDQKIGAGAQEASRSDAFEATPFSTWVSLEANGVNYSQFFWREKLDKIKVLDKIFVACLVVLKTGSQSSTVCNKHLCFLQFTVCTRTMAKIATTMAISMTRPNVHDKLKNKILFPISVKEEQRDKKDNR